MELDANKLKKIHTYLVLDIFKGSAIKWSNGPLLENRMAISLVAMANLTKQALLYVCTIMSFWYLRGITVSFVISCKIPLPIYVFL